MALVSSINELSTTSELVHTAINGNGQVPEGVLIYNDASVITVFVGGPTVDEDNGIPIVAGASLSLDMVSGEKLYAISASGTPIIRILVTHQ